LLPSTYKILSTILFSRLIPDVDEITGYHKCGFRCNGSTTDQRSAFVRYWRNNCEYNGTVYQLFIDFEKVYDSLREIYWTKFSLNLVNL
jgi:hypothetical protein